MTRSLFGAFELSVALQQVWKLVGEVNQYIVKREPWKLAKTPDDRALLESTLYHSADAIRVVAALVDPVMPEAAERIRRMLGLKQEQWANLRQVRLPQARGSARSSRCFRGLKRLSRSSDRWTRNRSAAQGSPWRRVPHRRLARARRRLKTTAFSIDEFMKVELRVAKVLEAEAVPKSKKLMKLKVDVGNEQRTIVAGIAEAYQAEQLVGRTIAIVFNLKTGKADGHRIQRDGARRQRWRRQAGARRLRSGRAAWRTRPVIDSHCHIAGAEFVEDLEAVIERAQQAHLTHALVILAADDEPEIEQGASVSARWPAVRFSIGVHPHAAGKFASNPADAISRVDEVITAQPLTRALGEIGLDYHYDFAPRECSSRCFASRFGWRKGAACRS